MILIIGATGHTGSEAARLLLAKGERVRAVTRDPEKARRLDELHGAEIVGGDSYRPETLDGVFDGVEKMYLVPATDLNWNAAQTAIIEAARDAGVQHIVKMSALGAGPDQPSMSLRFHYQGEQDIEASGMAYTHVRPNSFFQNCLFDVPPIQAEGRFYSAVGDAQFAKIDTRDIAEVVAKVLTEDGHEGKTYEITGPEPLSYDDIAARLSAAAGRPIEYVNLSPEEYAASLEVIGFEDWNAEEFANIYGRGFYRESGGRHVTDTVEQLLGRPPRNFDDWARENAAAFR
jgi:uncharacterized protein YbjT (DUF2867 family)